MPNFDDDPKFDDDVFQLLRELHHDDLIARIRASLNGSVGDRFHCWLGTAFFEEYHRREGQTGSVVPRFVCVEWKVPELTDALNAASRLRQDAEQEKKPQLRALFDRLIGALEEERKFRCDRGAS